MLGAARAAFAQEKLLVSAHRECSQGVGVAACAASEEVGMAGRVRESSTSLIERPHDDSVLELKRPSWRLLASIFQCRHKHLDIHMS